MKYTKAGKNTGYLGHFSGCLKDGHNTNEMPADMKNIKAGVPKEKKPEKTETRPPLPGGVRG